MTKKPILRLAKLSDEDAMTEVFFNALQKTSGGIPSDVKEGIKSSQSSILNQMLLQNGSDIKHVVVALENEKVIGYIACDQSQSDTIVIEELYTDENDCHAGSYLLSHALLYAEHKNAEQIALEAAVKAVKFYEQFGFVQKDYNPSGICPMTLDIKKARSLKLE